VFDRHHVQARPLGDVSREEGMYPVFARIVRGRRRSQRPVDPILDGESIGQLPSPLSAPLLRRGLDQV
jgi:hypothetical protein